MPGERRQAKSLLVKYMMVTFAKESILEKDWQNDGKKLLIG
jgi:hypothetical protein